MDHKQIAYVLLRITMGLVLLFYGVEKFVMGRAAIAGAIAHEFEKTILPAGLVRLFAALLPFGELTLGFCVLFGLFTTLALALAALLLASLTFGQVLLSNAQVVANNLIYCLIVFLLLFFVEHNALSLDQAWKNRPRK